MNLSFENKVALVTGAGSGMGLATAKAFTEAGASVVLADMQEEAVRAAAEQLSLLKNAPTKLISTERCFAA